MSCPELAELEALATEQLDHASKATVRAHVASCESCATSVDEIRENLGVVAPLRAVWQSGDGSLRERTLPQRIGPYAILRRIARGGMGTVYEARQENPNRIVALKVIHQSRAYSSALRRFAFESQVLGRLKHPCIAQIYEASTADTDDGPLPYFAMELVQGRPLHEYLQDERLGARQMLEIFVQICAAVHHAHQQGIIHRDLKPANILVEDSGRPKILDFGVARAIDADLAATTFETQAGQIVGTLPYMSPEQVGGRTDEIDTRTDVYSLGVVLYETLSGRLPYELRTTTIPEAIRLIREEEPPPLRTINTQYRGDLDTIVAKAMHKERGRRYASTAELGADVRRYLDHEPVLARPASSLYQLRKLARRHSVLVASVCVVLAALTIGGGVGVWQALRATRAERQALRLLAQSQAAQDLAEQNEARAKAEADKAQAVVDFLQDMLATVDPQNTPDRKDASLMTVLSKTIRELDDGKLHHQPIVEATIRTTVGNALRSLGRYDDAEPQLTKAIAITREHRQTGELDLARALNKFARLQEQRGHLREAEGLFRESLGIYESTYGPRHADVAKLQSNLGVTLHEQGRYLEAATLQRKALEVRKEVFGAHSTDVATSLNNLAISVSRLGNRREAVRLLRQSLEIDTSIRGAHHPNVATTMSNLATYLNLTGQREEAIDLHRQSLEIRRSIYGEAHPHVANSMQNLAAALDDVGAFAEAEKLYRHALRIQRDILGDEHPVTANTVMNLALMLARSGRLDEALPLARQGLAARLTTLGADHIQTIANYYELGQVLEQEGEWHEAASYFATAIEGADKSDLLRDKLVPLALEGRGRCLLELQDYPAAEKALLRAHDLLSRLGRPTAEAERSLHRLYTTWNKPDKAKAWAPANPE